MFGDLGMAEAAIILVLALFVFGPERLPGLSRDAGRALRKLRGYLKGLKDDLATELGPEVGDLDLTSLRPREFVRKHLLDDEEDQVPTRVSLGAGETPPWDPDTT